jgi:hypothetical protein
MIYLRFSLVRDSGSTRGELEVIQKRCQHRITFYGSREVE